MHGVQIASFGILTTRVSQLSRHWNTVPDTQNLKEKRFNLAHRDSVIQCRQAPGSAVMAKGRGRAELLRLWQLGSRADEQHQKAEQGTRLGPKVTSPSHTPETGSTNPLGGSLANHTD